MKIHYEVLLLVLGLSDCADQKKPVSAPALAQERVAATEVKTEPTNAFKPVAEMLGRSCAPCHNPGGKMYERLPFDNPETVSSHGASILGRIKSPEDHTLLETWLAAHPEQQEDNSTTDWN
jgi:hypothetical protein